MSIESLCACNCLLDSVLPPFEEVVKRCGEKVRTFWWKSAYFLVEKCILFGGKVRTFP